MEVEKIKSIVEVYTLLLTAKGVVAEKIETNRTFGSCTQKETLSHAAYLCENIVKFVDNPEKLGKTNRHLTAIQMCLSFANLYTLEDLMSHNRPT